MTSCSNWQTEDCASDQQFMLCTLLQKGDAIAVALSYSFSPNHCFQVWWSVPTLALKSPRSLSLSVRCVECMKP